jgi:hypothetical protein
MTCQTIRAATLAQGEYFIDARPAFRRAAAKAFIPAGHLTSASAPAYKG